MSEELEVTREEDEAFEALARRNDALEDEKHTLATVADQQERRIELLEARVAAERERADALAAHIRAIKDADDLYSDDAAAAKAMGRVLYGQQPDTSLAQLKARVLRSAADSLFLKGSWQHLLLLSLADEIAAGGGYDQQGA